MTKIFTALTIISGLCFLLVGCAAQAPTPRIFWPLDNPKIEWLGNYQGDNDFEKTATEKLIAEAVGELQSVQLRMPFDAVSDSLGNIYVTDKSQGNIIKFDFINSAAFKLVADGFFSQPGAITIDSKDQLYVVDSVEDSIKVFTTQGLYVETINTQDYVSRPSYVAINERLNRLYVSDPGKHKIAVFDLTGEHLFNFGSRGNDEGELHLPQGIAISAKDEVFVADTFNNRIQVFDAEGKFLDAFGQIGDRIWDFERPKDLDFDSEGNLHIVDERKGLLLIYSTDGDLLLTLGGKVAQNYTLGMASPKGVFLDNDDRIIIVDMLLKRFMLYQFLSEEAMAKNPITPADIQNLQEFLKGNQ